MGGHKWRGGLNARVGPAVPLSCQFERIFHFSPPPPHPGRRSWSLRFLLGGRTAILSCLWCSHHLASRTGAFTENVGEWPGGSELSRLRLRFLGFIGPGPLSRCKRPWPRPTKQPVCYREREREGKLRPHTNCKLRDE